MMLLIGSICVLRAIRGWWQTTTDSLLIVVVVVVVVISIGRACANYSHVATTVRVKVFLSRLWLQRLLLLLLLIFVRVIRRWCFFILNKKFYLAVMNFSNDFIFRNLVFKK
jgi:hypothetical protein